MAQGASTCASFAPILVADSTNLCHLRHPSSIEMSHKETTMSILWQKLPTNLTWSIKQTTQLHLQPTHIRFPCQKTQPTSGNLMKRKEKTQHSFPVLTFWNQNYKFPQKLTEEKNPNTMENQTTNKTSIAKMTSNTPNLISLGDHKMR